MGLDMYLYASRKGDEKKAVLKYDNDSSTCYVLRYPDGRKEEVNVRHVRFTHPSGKNGWYWSYYVNGKRVARKEIANPVGGEFAYWRKFNALHRWFVENYEGGHEDDCEEHEVKVEKLKHLLGVLKKIDALCPAKELPDWDDEAATAKFEKDALKVVNENLELFSELEPCDGFFFGSTKYDTDYFWYVRFTLGKVQKLMDEIRKGNVVKVTYQASW